MANYNIWARSNSVKVKDIEGLKKSLDVFGYTLEDTGENSYSIDPPDECGWYNFDESGEKEFDPQEHVIPYLEDGEVFITIEVGQEKLRYLGGCARAFIKDEESIIISLDDIYYEVKQKWGIVPNRAES